MLDGSLWRLIGILPAMLAVAGGCSAAMGAEQGSKAPTSNDLKEVVITGKKIVPDEVVTERVQQALTADPILYAEHVTVRTSNGIVYLEGQVSDSWDLRRLLRDARRVAGVKRVVQQLDMTSYSSDGPGW